MAFKISKVDVWAGQIEDRPGALAQVLNILAKARVDIEFLIARRASDRPGATVVYLTPIRGAKQAAAAQVAGLSKAASLGSLRVEGPNRSGLGAKIMGAIAQAGINVRGTSASAVGTRSVAYFAFESPDDAQRAASVVKKALSGK